MMAPRSASFKLLYGFSKISSYNLGYEPVFFKLLLYRFWKGNSNESFFKKKLGRFLWYNGHLESQLSTDEIYLSGDVSLPDVSSMYFIKNESTKEQIKSLKFFGIKGYTKGSCQFVEIKSSNWNR